MSKHTQGPWEIKFRKDHSSYISIGDHKTGPHKQFDLMFDDRDATDVADARLIAAAPDMLETLKRLREMCADFGANTACEVASAVIDKATGETK